MLSIDIEKGSDVFIGNDIQVKFKRSVGKDCIRLCIAAPDDVKVLRGSLYRKQFGAAEMSREEQIEAAYAARGEG